MKKNITKEDFEILYRLSECLYKTSLLTIGKFPLNEEIIELNVTICKFNCNVCKLKIKLDSVHDYNSLNLSDTLNINLSNTVKNLLDEIEILNEKLYNFIDRTNIYKSFKKFHKFKNYSMITQEYETNFFNLII